MIQAALGLAWEAVKFGIGQGLRLFGVLSVLILLALAAWWGLVFVLRPGSGINIAPPVVWWTFFGLLALILICGFAAAHRAAFAPDDRLPYVPVLAQPLGLSLFQPLRLAVGHVIPLLASAVVLWAAFFWLPGRLSRPLPEAGYAVTVVLAFAVLWLSARLLTYPAQIVAEARLNPGRSLHLARGLTARFFLTLLLAWITFAALTAVYMVLCYYGIWPLAGGEFGTIDQISMPIQIVFVITLMLYIAMALGFWAGLSAAAYRAAVTRNTG